MKNILKWFSAPKPAEPVDKPVAPERVLKELSGFKLAESEVHNLSTVITTQFALDRMVSALEGQRWAESAAKHRSARHDLERVPRTGYQFQARQALVSGLPITCGMDLYPAFEAAISSLNECGGFGSVLNTLLYSPVGSDGTYNVSVLNEGIKVSINGYGRTYVNYEVFAPWTVVSSVGEREFWLRFARKMTSIALQDQTPTAANVRFHGNLGTLTMFASQLASVS